MYEIFVGVYTYALSIKNIKQYVASFLISLKIEKDNNKLKILKKEIRMIFGDHQKII